jgi:DNA-binding response OmpR family regulator
MVLLYEPDPDLAPLWQSLLEHMGCTVRVARSLDEVAQLAQEQRPALAVVRPGDPADGWAVCQQLQSCIGAPVIGLLPPEALGEPVADLHALPLPVDPRALREVVQLLMAMILA